MRLRVTKNTPVPSLQKTVAIPHPPNNEDHLRENADTKWVRFEGYGNERHQVIDRNVDTHFGRLSSYLGRVPYNAVQTNENSMKTG